jgi:hypothetical protein
MAISPYNDKYVFDESRGIYLARDFFDGQRAIAAAEKVGLEILGSEKNRFIHLPTDPQNLEKIMSSLSPHPNFPGYRSRVPSVCEYTDLMRWAESNDRDLFRTRGEFQILYDNEKGLYVVGSDFPMEEYSTLEDYIYPLGFEPNVREVLEKSR